MENIMNIFYKGLLFKTTTDASSNRTFIHFNGHRTEFNIINVFDKRAFLKEILDKIGCGYFTNTSERLVWIENLSQLSPIELLRVQQELK